MNTDNSMVLTRVYDGIALCIYVNFYDGDEIDETEIRYISSKGEMELPYAVQRDMYVALCIKDEIKDELKSLQRRNVEEAKMDAAMGAMYDKAAGL